MGIRTRNLDELVVNLGVPGTQSVGSNKTSFVVPFHCVLVSLLARLGTAGTTNNQDVDLLRNGTSFISSANKIRFASGSTTPATGSQTFNPDPPVFSAGDRITVNVNAVHTTPAVNLDIVLVLRRSGGSPVRIDTIAV